MEVIMLELLIVTLFECSELKELEHHMRTHKSLSSEAITELIEVLTELNTECELNERPENT